MPARQPFTHLCQLMAYGPEAGRADLHTHTTHSDGTYSPGQVVDLARRCGLAALALTDHDTLGGVRHAQAIGAANLQIIPGVEITTEYRERELHLLAYFVDVDDGPLNRALEGIRHHRRERFREIIERLRGVGVVLDECDSGASGSEAPGRRHLAEALVRQGKAANIRQAFQRYLGDGNRLVVPKKRLPIGEALALVRGAGGVAAWAHPSYDCDRESLLELRALGLRAVEVEYPEFRPSQSRELRALATDVELAVTGGSDCHGPGRRNVGVRTIDSADLGKLRELVDS